MSQSDEHESAIIENENNSNKVMESQGALGSSAADRSDFILADTSSLPHLAGTDDDCESQEEEGMDMDINEGSAGESKYEDMNVVVREEDTMGVEPTDQSGADGEEESMSDYAKGDAEESMLESVTGDAEEMPGLPEEMASAAADEARTEHSSIKNHLDEDANEMDVDDTSAQERAAEEEGEEREAMGEADEAEWSREGMATASVDNAEVKEHTVTAENVAFAEMGEGIAWGKEEGQTHLKPAAPSPDVSRKDELKDSKFTGDEVEANVIGETEVEAPQEEAIDNEKQSEEKLIVSESRVQSTLSAEVEDAEQDDMVMGEDLVMKKQMDEDDYALQSVGQVEDSTVTSEEEDKLLSNEESQHADDRNKTKESQTDKQAVVHNVTAAVKMDSAEEKKQKEAEEIEAETGRCADDQTADTDFGQKDDLLDASVEASEGQGQGDNEKEEEADDDIQEDAGDQAEKPKHSTSESCVVGEAGDVCPDGDDVMPSYADAVTNQEGDAETLPEMAAAHREGIVEGEKSRERVVINQSEEESSAEKQPANNKDDSSSMEADEPSAKTGEQVSDSVPQMSKAVDKKETKGKEEQSASVHKTSAKAPPDDDDDVVVLDDDDDETIAPAVKKEALDRTEDSTALFNSSNDMGIQIESVSGGADELHDLAEQPSRQENGMFGTAVEPKKESSGVAGSPSAAKKPAPKTQMCIVCKRVGKCKYNIVRNGDIKHLCDDVCFQRFRTNPTLYLKGTAKKEPALAPASTNQPSTAGKSGQTVAGYKTCVVCQLMNINTQGQFCMWKGLDFCGENCLGKFQANLATSCATCAGYIPLTARSANCLRIGSEVRPFCSQRCYLDYKQRMRLCAFCQKDLSSASDSFSAPVGSEGVFKDFCSQICMKKYEDLLSNDVEIIRVEQGKVQPSNKCSVCQKIEVSKHTMKYGGQIHHLCSDPCLSAFQYANKLNMNSCDQCSALCTTLESSPHLVQFEGQQKRFCSDACVNIFRTSNRKISPCAWCGSEKSNFDMIERLDSNNKFQLFCSLNCLSLYRVNLQAKSNQSVTCDQCLKFVPAQYHLTMSDASVRNFCSYTCVMTFQSQFTSKAVPPPPKSSPDTAVKHRHNTRGSTQQTTNQPSFPIISNVVSLAPQGGQKVNIKSPAGIPVVVSGSSQTIKAAGVASTPGGLVQQHIIIQPPPPKVVKNKSLLCKPFVQTKATSCRPHTQTCATQTDDVKTKPTLIPVPVPVYLPVPCAMYTAPTPTPVFIPIPIPVPVFIPTTRRSASGIMKHIKEIQEKIPTDPLEAEILMMAAAVATDGKHSSDSESDDDDMLRDIGSKRKAIRDDDEDDDENDADVMPLTGPKESEVGGEEDMIQMALRMAEEMSGPIADLESAVEAVPINTEPPPATARTPSPVEQTSRPEHEFMETRSSRGRGSKRASTSRRSSSRTPKRPRVMPQQPEVTSTPVPPEALPPQLPPADANYHLKFTYGVNAWRHWVLFKNAQLERAGKRGSGRIKLFKTDILQCTADELNYSLCLFVKEVRKPSGDEYSPDSIYYLCLGIQQYLFENGRIDNIFTDLYYEKFTECLTDILSRCQPKFNAAGQMVCRIEEEHLWECKQLGAHSPYVLLNTLIYFHTKYFMLKTPEDHMKLSFAHILKYWKKGQPGKGGQPTRSVSLRYYSVSTAKKDGSAPTSTTKKGSKEGIPVYEVTENQDNPLRCPVKLYEFYLSKCPESIKNRSDIFYPVPERSCVPDSPVWYSTTPIGVDTMTKMLTRILLVREIQEAHLHAQPIYV